MLIILELAIISLFSSRKWSGTCLENSLDKKTGALRFVKKCLSQLSKVKLIRLSFSNIEALLTNRLIGLPIVWVVSSIKLVISLSFNKFALIQKAAIPKLFNFATNSSASFLDSE